MKNGWTTHSSNNAIWLALSPCHMTMTCKINKLEKPGGPLSIFHTLFGRSAAFYGHFRADTVMSEWSTSISSSYPPFLAKHFVHPQVILSLEGPTPSSFNKAGRGGGGVPNYGLSSISVSVILSEKFWKDWSTLPSETFRILSQFTFSKSVINFLELKCLKFCL